MRWHKRHESAKEPVSKTDVEIVLARLFAVTDRLEGVYERFEAQADRHGLPPTTPIDGERKNA